jgi:hypothetical protein
LASFEKNLSFSLAIENFNSKVFNGLADFAIFLQLSFLILSASLIYPLEGYTIKY